MKLVIQRVKNAKVEVENKVVGNIGRGFLVLVGVTHEDDEEKAKYLAKKLCNLRIFTDENDKMNLFLKDVKGELLIVSQFTLYADCTNGNRPSFVQAAKPDKAEALYEIEASATYNEQLLTLSTCSYHVKDGRFAVIARKINKPRE